ncbi:MAG: 30S ribosomal protein S6 [Firmicutes bacterium]|nr:30S ribosomal protein S6 [Bacillota bacterium]
MQKYEVLYVLAAALENEKKETFIEKYSKLVVSNGGVVDSVNKWGLKKLAYPINYKNEGFYVLMNYQANADFNAELERQFRIAKDEVIRFMVTKAIEAPILAPKKEKPKAVKKEKEEAKAISTEEVKTEEIKEETKQENE